MISNAKYGNKGFLPELQVISSGVLKGYVSVNPRWAGFTADDYRAASASVCGEKDVSAESQKIEVTDGTFDLRGFEVARAEFFSVPDKPAVTFAGNYIRFSSYSLKKFPKQKYVELLVHPGKLLLAVRPCTKDTRNAVQWTTANDQPANIWCMAYISTLFSLFNWKKELRYRIIGQLFQKENESFLLFDLHDTQVNISSGDKQEKTNKTPVPENASDKTHKNIIGYPVSWSNNFGKNYYSKQLENDQIRLSEGDWNSSLPSVPYKESDLKVTHPDEVKKAISSIIHDMKQEITNDTRQLYPDSYST